MNLIKRFLIGKGYFQNSKELVFIQTGGVRGMGQVTKLVTAREDSLPYVLLDSDKAGNDYAKQLKSDRYKGEEERILQVADFLGDQEFEIEDLIPSELLIRLVDRKYRGERYFEDCYKKGEPNIVQIEAWAKENSINLENNSWKAEIAKEVYNKFDMRTVNEELVEVWKNLFDKLLS
ncbi:hypothetical protein D3C76_1252010 [compost metagenome]